MSLYRQASGSRTRTAIVAVVAVLAGGIAGYVIGRQTAPEPTLQDQIADAREAARPALSSLELVEIEYAQGVGEGGEPAAPTELGAALDHAAAAAAALEAADGLGVVDPTGLQAASSALDELQDAIRAEVDAAEVRELVAQARTAIEDLSGSQDPP